MENSQALFQGKAKIFYPTDQEDLVLMYFTDQMSYRNGLKIEEIANKGILNNQISSLLFQYLEKQAIENHFVKMANKRACFVKKLNMLPLEVIVRNTAAGSFSKNFNIPEGLDFDQPVFEYTLKSDPLHDPLINRSQILALNLASAKDLDLMEEIALKTNQALIDLFQRCKIKLIDFKIEFGHSPDGKLLLGDEISPDNCRLWDRESLEKLDKDRFRQKLGGLEEAYKEVLQRLQNVFQKGF